MDPLDDKKLEEVVPGDEAIAEMPATAESEAPEAEAPMEEMPKASEAFRGRIKSAYPDLPEDDDEAFYQKASEQLDNLEQYRNNNIEANKLLMEVFNAEPVIVEVLEDVGKGASFREAIARHFSPEELNPIEGDPDYEGWTKNAEARAKRLTDNEIANKTRAENNEFTMKEIKAFAEKNGISNDKAEEELEKIGAVLEEVFSGRISASILQTIYNGVNHENDVKTAEDTGVIKGRNEKIEVKKEPKMKGDGLPILGNSKDADVPVKKASWIDGIAENEKRKKIL